MKTTRVAAGIMVLASLALAACHQTPKEVERPEKVVSLTKVLYDSTTYAKLAGLWEKYYEAYPSEDAYANWMYAADYADLSGYESMLARGVEKYPANPTLLYLSGKSKNRTNDREEGRQLLQRAAALDPDYMDPWFSLAVAYIVQGDRENADVALRHILNGGAVQDVVMDFCYNVLASLDTGAILITNGDNDTFPGWILTRIVRFRPDVNIVNQSLLNLDSYASSIVNEGVPEFISHDGIDSLKGLIAADKERYKRGQIPPEDFVGLGDRLVFRIIAASERAGRPVYFACTMNNYGKWKQKVPQPRDLGLVALVTPTSKPYPSQLRRLFRTWTTEYRSGGLDSWQLQASGETSAGRWLSMNYAAALHTLMHQIEEAGPDVQLSLFRWYRDHVVGILQKKSADTYNSMWFDRRFPEEIRAWSRSKGWSGD